MSDTPERIDFFEQVWQVVREIPPGRVTSYGAIAKALGAAKSSRMVGFAMNASHAAVVEVPAHRVVNRNGVLTGKHHFPAPGEMQRKLEAEGIAVVDDRVQNFEALFWNPIEELGGD